MISGTQVLSRMADTVKTDQLNRKGLLVERLRQVSAKLDDIQVKISKAKATGDINRVAKLCSLFSRCENDRLSIIALMSDGRFVQPTTRSVARVVKTELERKQGKAYSQLELAGRDTRLITNPKRHKRFANI